MYFWSDLEFGPLNSVSSLSLWVSLYRVIVFLENSTIDFPIFCVNASLRECKIVRYLFDPGKLENLPFWAKSKSKKWQLFWWKFKNDPFWPKLSQIWHKFGHIQLYLPECSARVFKIFLEKILQAKKSTLMNPIMTPPLPTRTQILKFLKWRFFIYLVEICLVYLKLNFLVSFYSQIGVILTKNGQK